MRSEKNTALVCLASVLLILAVPITALAQAGRDFVYVVGSSTVYPFATIVAERFGRSSGFRTPKVESSGSGGGIKLFCDGVGVAYPDVVNASRPITPSELSTCAANGVDAVVEVRIGYGGIVLGNAAEGVPLSLSLQQLYLALAKRLPRPGAEEMQDNPYRRWRDIDPRLPDLDIKVFGPPPTSGTRDAFVTLVFEPACRATEWLADLERTRPERFRALCHSMREDGRYVESGENDNLVVQKLRSNHGAYGLFGFSYLEQNATRVKAATIDGVQPTYETIGSGRYPLSRPLYFYVKKAHVPVIPGFEEYLAEFTHERAWGDEGYLAYRGLVPQSADERREALHVVKALEPLAIGQR